MILLLLSILFAFVYATNLIKAASGWDLLRKNHTEKGQIPVTVLIPFRNEAYRMQAQLESLVKQGFTKQDEVIFLNDHSSDNGPNLVKAYLPKIANSIMVNIPEDCQGKKAALAYGVERAKNNWIITTDADCTYNKNWLKQWKNTLFQTQNHLLVGPVRLKASDSFLSKFQSLEFAGLMTLGFGYLSKGQAHTCSGANLAFLRGTFKEVNGYEGNQHFASGDDEFLMHKFFLKNPDWVSVAYHPDLLCSSLPATSSGQFFKQRLRWASKGKGYKVKSYKYQQVLVGMYFVLFWICFGQAFHNHLAQSACAVLFFTKLAFDYYLLNKSDEFFKVKPLLVYLPMAQIIQYIYIPLVAVGSLFYSGKWKGRKVR